MNADEMRQMIDRAAAELGRLGATPLGAHAVEAARSEDPTRRFDALAEVATTRHLIRHGVQPPDDFRISLRTFEDPDATPYEPLVSFHEGRGTVYCNGSIITVEEKRA